MNYSTLLTIVNFYFLPIISKFSSSLTHHMIASFFNLTLIPVSDRSIANSMRLNIAKKRLASSTRKINVMSYEYQLFHATVTRTNSIKCLDVFFHSKLHFLTHVDYIFSGCMKLLGLIRSITYRFSSLECSYCDMSTHCWVTQPASKHRSVNTSRPNTLHNNRGSRVFSVPYRAEPHCTTLVALQPPAEQCNDRC
jgi:hypothetical protein